MSSAKVMTLQRPEKPATAATAAPTESGLKRPSKPAGTKGSAPAESSTPANLQRAAPTGTVQMPFQVPAEVRRQFKAYAAERDMTQSDLFLLAWEEYRNNHS